MVYFTSNGRKFGWAAAFAALAVSAAAISSGTAAPTGPEIVVKAVFDKSTGAPAPQDEDVAERFADAPYGVDPVVTGPVSTAFRQQREAANCDNAVWPNVPAVCYPD